MRRMATIRGRSASVLVAVATAIGIVAITLPLFLNPVWVAFEQDRAQAAAWTGFTPADLRVATDAILADLVVGPPDFDVAIDGRPLLDVRERDHMRDVRTVFIGFFAVALMLVVGAGIVAARRRAGDRIRTWRAVRAGAIGLVAVLVAVGVIALVAFDALFEVFHRLFFAGGSYTFDPATERLVQLFPFQFWQDTAMAVGAVSIILAGIVALVASSRLGDRSMASGGEPTSAESAPAGSR